MPPDIVSIVDNLLFVNSKLSILGKIFIGVIAMIPIEELRELCKKRNSSIKQMEEELGIGNGVIAKWYKRGTDPAHTRLQQIADYLSVSIEYLATGEEKQPAFLDGLSEDEIRVLSAYRAIAKNKRPGYLDMLERAGEHKE